MKLTDVSFPHPVLGVDDSVNSTIEFEPTITSNIDSYTISIICEHDNDDLASLITCGQAELFCEVTCSSTLYRKVFTDQANEIVFDIPKKQVKGKVSFSCLLVTKQPLAAYQNSMSHPDYDGFIFELDRGEVLARFGEFSFSADINYEKLKAVSSFMEVVENNDEKAEYTNFDLSKGKIEIQLPSTDYRLFASDSISKEQKFASIFHSSIVLNALLSALYNLETYQEMAWAQVIKYRLKNEDQFQNISVEEKENIPEIAQRLLGNPFNRLLSQLYDINISPETDD
jgi:hypothetical protein